MKKILYVCLIAFCVLSMSGCKCNNDNEVNFTYFKDKISSIDGYKYYVLSQKIYSGSLLTYEKEKKVYLNNEKYRIEIIENEINDLESEDMYSKNIEEYYQYGTDFYYKENNEWKIKQNEKMTGLGYSISKKMFSKYVIEEKNNIRYFNGDLKDEELSSFLGFELSGVSEVKLNIEVSGTNKLKFVSLEYKEENGNKVVVSISVGYTQIIKFDLPIVE